MNVLITGCEGFIGSYLVQTLLDNGYEVWGIDNFSKYGKIDKNYYSNKKFHFIEGDVKNTDLLVEIGKNCEHFIALAAMIGGIGYFHRLAYDLLSENEKILSSTFDAAIKLYKNNNLKKISVVSSSMVFENAFKFPTPEEHINEIPPPDSTYGFQKLACEYYAKGAYEQYGLPYTILRPFNCVGIGEITPVKDREDKKKFDMALSHVVPDLTVKILKNQYPVEILGDGNQIRHYTSGKDLARGIMLSLENKNALNNDFNLSSPVSTSVLELAEKIFKKINPDIEFKYISVKPFTYDVQKRIPDTSKSFKLLGFETQESLDDILDEVIPWIKNELEKGNI